MQSIFLSITHILSLRKCNFFTEPLRLHVNIIQKVCKMIFVLVSGSNFTEPSLDNNKQSIYHENNNRGFSFVYNKSSNKATQKLVNKLLGHQLQPIQSKQTLEIIISLMTFIKHLAQNSKFLLHFI